MKKGVGDLFQKETKYFRGKLGGGPLLWHAKPETYKHYPKTPKTKLGPPAREEGMSLWHAINERRSIRNFADEPLDQTTLSQLLWASQGITRAS